MLKNMLTTVWCSFGCWSYIFVQPLSTRFGQDCGWSSGEILKLKFGQYFAAEVCLRWRSWILVKIMKLGLVKILKFKFSRDADVWLKFWSWCLVEILKMKFDQDLFSNLWYELNPRVRCAFGNVYTLHNNTNGSELEYTSHKTTISKLLK